MTVALRILCSGVSADFVDEYVRIGESTAIESLRRLVKAIVEIYSEEYLRKPDSNDLSRLLAESEQRGFPGMLGSIDCMHWKWKNCPAAWKGSHNDINVLDRSPLFSDLTEGRAPPVKFKINDHEYDMGYYLADGIYPSWSTFVKIIPCPQGNKNKFFAQAQESAWKDVERAFGVLQARFAIVRGPSRFWDLETLNYIMKACILLHNMIVEDERDVPEKDFNYDTIGENSSTPISPERTVGLQEFIQRHHHITNKEIHSQLHSDLVEHLWRRHGEK